MPWVLMNNSWLCRMMKSTDECYPPLPTHSSEYVLDKLKGSTEIWDPFTRRVEYNANLLYQRGRFPSYLRKGGNFLDPKVSEFLVAQGLDIEYPSGEDFGICLTHDIGSWVKVTENNRRNRMQEIHFGDNCHFSRMLALFSNSRTRPDIDYIRFSNARFIHEYKQSLKMGNMGEAII